MTKAGEASKIADIRIYVGSDFGHLADYHPIAAFTERVVLQLRSVDYSFGSASHLYLRLQRSGNFNAEMKFRPGFEHWVWYADSLIQDDFEELDETLRFKFVSQAVRSSLLELTPERAEEVNSACDAAIEVGSKIRFPVKSKAYKNARVAITVNVADPPDRPIMIVEVMSPQTGVVILREEVVLSDHRHAFKLVSSIKMSERRLTLLPRNSFSAQLDLRKYDLPLTFDLPN